jgi:hypothetical protein
MTRFQSTRSEDNLSKLFMQENTGISLYVVISAQRLGTRSKGQLTQLAADCHGDGDEAYATISRLSSTHMHAL